MIAAISIVTPSGKTACPTPKSGQKAVIDLSSVGEMLSFDIEIVFSQPITRFRTHDYRWERAGSGCIAGSFAPKIIQLADGCHVQSSIQNGIWEITGSKTMLWRFNPAGAAPLTVYGNGHGKQIVSAKTSFPSQAALLFSFSGAIEFSRSAVPFAGVACFTDHCDFDTPESLVLQREFFKKAGIRVTKGFFLNHFSKRPDNASVAREPEEFKKWRDDGHELAYHSLSQSIKSDKDSFNDFQDFTPPYPDLPTWIDHGYQPYNLSLYAHRLSDEDFAATLHRKNITTLWNYIDSGTATTGVINQLNPSDFTLSKFSAGNKDLSFKTRLGQLVKNIMFHYYADERIVGHYKQTAGNAKKVLYQKQWRSIWPLVKNVFGLGVPVGRVFLGWATAKNKPYRLAKYTPVVFGHRIAGRHFYIFQTVEMVDFARGLSVQNTDKLIAESGLFIAHTYFSVPASYHHGKMFSHPDQIDERVARNFHYLGEKVRSGEIWNPTLHELVDFLANFERAVLDVDASGNIIVTDAHGLPYRTVN